MYTVTKIALLLAVALSMVSPAHAETTPTLAMVGPVDVAAADHGGFDIPEACDDPGVVCLGFVGQWPTTCTPGGFHVERNETTRQIDVWQETPESGPECRPTPTKWQKVLPVPVGVWSLNWTVDARDGEADQMFAFMVRAGQGQVFVPYLR